MSEQTMPLAPPAEWVTTTVNGRPSRRRLRGLRMPALPTGAWLAQVGGGMSALLGVHLQFGAAVALMVGGVAALVLGALREAGKV